METESTNIYNYTDFRKFLRDRLAFLKSIHQPVSYRQIAEIAGFKSSGFLTQILDGSCGIPDRLIEKIWFSRKQQPVRLVQ